jgi:hypothetical protein
MPAGFRRNVMPPEVLRPLPSFLRRGTLSGLSGVPQNIEAGLSPALAVSIRAIDYGYSAVFSAISGVTASLARGFRRGSWIAVFRV